MLDLENMVSPRDVLVIVSVVKRFFTSQLCLVPYLFIYMWL